jgi:hypothetical protein
MDGLCCFYAFTARILSSSACFCTQFRLRRPPSLWMIHSCRIRRRRVFISRHRALHRDCNREESRASVGCVYVWSLLPLCTHSAHTELLVDCFVDDPLSRPSFDDILSLEVFSLLLCGVFQYLEVINQTVFSVRFLWLFLVLIEQMPILRLLWFRCFSRQKGSARSKMCCGRFISQKCHCLPCPARVRPSRTVCADRKHR